MGKQGKEKPKVKCPELEDELFEQLRDEMQTFKSAIKAINLNLPKMKADVKAMLEPLQELNGDLVGLYDFNVAGSHERAVSIETATSAIIGLVKTQQASVKVGCIVNIDKFVLLIFKIYVNDFIHLLLGVCRIS
jgi:hypothetical protein